MERVYIVVSKFMNNFWSLHQGIVIAGKQVFFHNDPQLSIIDGAEYFNFDYMITDGNIEINGIEASRIVPPERLVMVKRYSKVEQAMRLNHYSRRPEFGKENFVPIKTWLHPQAMGASNLVSPTGKVVIKPKDGARGIGQFLVDTSKIPFAVMIDALDRYIKDVYKKVDLFKELNKYDPDMCYSVAGEQREDEGLGAIKSQGYIIQSFVDNILAEYRVITDRDGTPSYCQQRSIRGDKDFPQATGSDTNSILGDDVVLLSSVLPEDQLNDFKAMSAAVVGPLSSIDLFVTKDGKWGIFEYCNQFGIKGVPAQVVANLHTDFVEDLIQDPLPPPIMTPGDVSAAIATLTTS